MKNGLWAIQNQRLVQVAMLFELKIPLHGTCSVSLSLKNNLAVIEMGLACTSQISTDNLAVKDCEVPSK